MAENNELLQRFDIAMREIYDAARKLRPPYNATAFRKMVARLGGKKAADKLLAAPNPSSGFVELYTRGKENLKLSVEYLVLQDPWRQLFDDDQLDEARRRLHQVGCELPPEDAEEIMSPTTASAWLHYWTSPQVRKELAGGIITHIASNQFHRLSAGDRVWIVSVDEMGQLFTIGFVHSTTPVSREQAAKMVDDVPWEALHHVLVDEASAQEARIVDLSRIAERLRFQSPSDRLLLRQGRVNPQQLQTMRKLTAESATLLESVWQEGLAQQDREFKEISDALLDHDELDQKREVLSRTEQQFLRRHIMGSEGTGICMLCGAELPVSLLVAAHIKRRADCSDEERRDFRNNVVPLCVLGCDALFERRFVIVEDGIVRKGPRTTSAKAVDEFLTRVVGRTVRCWNEKTASYFHAHAGNPKAKSD